jgi:hypothetical protein
VRHRLDVLTGPDEQRPTLVARLLEQPPGGAQMKLAQCGDVHGAEEQRAVEDVVAREVLPVGQREDQRDHGGLEQRGGDLRETGASRAIGVQIGAGEHQHRDQVGKRDPVAGLVPGDRGA